MLGKPLRPSKQHGAVLFRDVSEPAIVDSSFGRSTLEIVAKFSQFFSTTSKPSSSIFA
jgi:hypothetical protein